MESKLRRQAEKLLLYNIVRARTAEIEQTARAEAGAGGDVGDGGGAGAGAAPLVHETLRSDPAVAAVAAARKGKAKAPDPPSAVPPEQIESDSSDLTDTDDEEAVAGDESPMSRAMRLSRAEARKAALAERRREAAGGSGTSIHKGQAKRKDKARVRFADGGGADLHRPDTASDALLAASLAAQDAAGGAVLPPDLGVGESGREYDGFEAARALNAELQTAPPSSGGAADGDDESGDEDKKKGEAGDGAHEYMLPAGATSLDPAALATLPQSIQQELLEQLREQQTAENRSTYQNLRKDAAAFSQTQMGKYVQSANFKRELERMKQQVGGGEAGLGGFNANPTPRRIAGEAGRELIFTKANEGVAPLASLREGTALYSLATGTNIETISHMYGAGGGFNVDDSRSTGRGASGGGVAGSAGGFLAPPPGERASARAAEAERPVASAFRPGGEGLQDALAVALATGQTVLPNPTGGRFTANRRFRAAEAGPQGALGAARAAMPPPPPRQKHAWDADVGDDADASEGADIAMVEESGSAAFAGGKGANSSSRALAALPHSERGAAEQVGVGGTRVPPGTEPEAEAHPNGGSPAIKVETDDSESDFGSDDDVVVIDAGEVRAGSAGAGTGSPAHLDDDTKDFMALIARHEDSKGDDAPLVAGSGGGGGSDGSDGEGEGDSDDDSGWEECDAAATEGNDAAGMTGAAEGVGGRTHEHEAAAAAAIAAAAEAECDACEVDSPDARVVVTGGVHEAAYRSVAGFLAATADVRVVWPSWLPGPDEIDERDGSAESPHVVVRERLSASVAARTAVASGEWTVELPVLQSLAAIREALERCHAMRAQETEDAAPQNPADAHASGGASDDAMVVSDDDGGLPTSAVVGHPPVAARRAHGDGAAADDVARRGGAADAPELGQPQSRAAREQAHARMQPPSLPQPPVSAHERADAAAAMRGEAEARAAELERDVAGRRRGQDDGPTPEMYEDIKELLVLFGVPYVDAPMEAEAQCAALEEAGLVDGVITDDSDAFLFGAQNVYRHIFDDKRYVEHYTMGSVSSKLGLKRTDLICLALLLGCDYTEGVRGVGIVNAYEIVTGHRGMEGLARVKEWVDAPDARMLAGVGEGEDAAKAGAGDSGAADGGTFAAKHRQVSKSWLFPPAFPSQVVYDAFASPRTDLPRRAMDWSAPDVNQLYYLAVHKLGVDEQEAYKRLDAMSTRLEQRATQTRVEDFFARVSGPVAKFRSKRMHDAVRRVGGDEAAVVGATGEAAAAKRQRKKGAVKDKGAGEASRAAKAKPTRGAPAARHASKGKIAAQTAAGAAAAAAAAAIAADELAAFGPDPDEDAIADARAREREGAGAGAGAGAATRPVSPDGAGGAGLNDAERKVLALLESEGGAHGIGINELACVVREYNKKQLREAVTRLAKAGLATLAPGVGERWVAL